MANTTNIQVILDGPRNCVVKVEGTLDTSDLASTVLVDPALLSTMGHAKAAKLRIMEINSSVEDLLEVRLAWDATAPKRIVNLVGSQEQCYEDFGGLVNDAGAGVNGKILISTEGWPTGKILSFTVVLQLVKQAS